MNFKGDGTEQIEEIIREIFPTVTIGRMDWIQQEENGTLIK